MIELNAPFAPSPSAPDTIAASTSEREASDNRSRVTARRVASASALTAAGDYYVFNLRDDSDEALFEVAAEWSGRAAEAIDSDGLIEIIDET